MSIKIKLIRKQLDEALARFATLSEVSSPSKGWIRAIRDALGMTASQLAKRIGTTQQAVARIEKDEVTGSVTIKTMRRIAEGLDCVFVCGFVPRTSLEDTVRRQAVAVATNRIARAAQTMGLESQDLSESENISALDDMVNELVDKMPSSFWNKI